MKTLSFAVLFALGLIAVAQYNDNSAVEAIGTWILGIALFFALILGFFGGIIRFISRQWKKGQE